MDNRIKFIRFKTYKAINGTLIPFYLNKKFQNYKELKSYHYNYNLIKLIKNSIKCNLLINI